MLLLSLNLTAQTSSFSRFDIVTDTAVYSSQFHSTTIGEQVKTSFYYSDFNETIEVRLFPLNSNCGIELVQSKDFILIDSLLDVGSYTRFKVQFSNLNQSALVRFTFRITCDTNVWCEEIHLLPLFKTTAVIRPGNNQLFIGEEKTYEVFSNNPDNINVSSEWINTESMDYRFSSIGGKIYLHVIPQKLGLQTLKAILATNNPNLSADKQLIYSISPIEYTFSVKASRLQFLSMDKSELTLNETARTEGIEVQLESSHLLQLNRTYRIENQEKKGGTLIA